MGEASFTVGTDLNGVLSADKEIGRLTIWAELGKVFGNELSVTEAAFANVTIDSGERNNDSGAVSVRESRVEDFGEGTSEGTDGVVFEVVDELTDEVDAATDDEDGGKILAI